MTTAIHAPHSADTIALDLRLAEALGQRMIRIPEQYDIEADAATCSCGGILIPLPRMITLKRVIMLGKTPYTVTHQMTHAHAADHNGNPLCTECWNPLAGGDPATCEHHDDGPCDMPEAVQCTMDDCLEPAPVQQPHCNPCAIKLFGE